MSGESARLSALGENNYITKYGDPHSILVNPSCIATNSGKNLFVTFEDSFSGDMMNGTACVTIKNIGFKISYINIPDIENRSDTGANTGSFNFNQFVASGTYGYKLNDRISVGLGINLLGKFVDAQNGLGLSVDLGGIYNGKQNYKIGAAVQNIGSQSSLNKGGLSSSLPLTFRLGGQYSGIKNLTLLTGLSYSSEPLLVWNIGAEYTPVKWLTLRLGTDTAMKSYSAVSGGLGINISDYQFDYTFNAHPDLGFTHSMSFTMAIKDKVIIKPQITNKEPVFETNKIVEQPVLPEPDNDKPITTDFDGKYLTITAGRGYFMFSQAEMSKLTDKGRKAVENARELLRYVYSLGLCNAKVLVTIEGNACTEGRSFVNQTLSEERAFQGMNFLYKALDGIADIEHLEIVRVPNGDRRSKELEDKYVADWKADHNSELPSSIELGHFRESCRNFKIVIKVDIEKWSQLRNDRMIVDRINTLSQGLSDKFEKGYKVYEENKNK